MLTQPRRTAASPCALQATETFGSFEDAGGDPAYLPSPPALDVTFHVAGSTDETLLRVCCGERTSNSQREPEGDDGHLDVRLGVLELSQAVVSFLHHAVNRSEQESRL